MRNNSKDIATRVLSEENPCGDASALKERNADNMIASNLGDFVGVEPMVYLMREMHELCPGKDLKIRVGEIEICASEPSLGNRVFGLITGLIGKIMKFAE